MTGALAFLAVSSLPGCHSKPGPVEAVDAGAPPEIAADPVATARKPTAYPAARCGDCHEPMHDEWVTSAHARSTSSALFKAMRAASGSAACNECHAPLEGRVEPGVAASEGVTCEVCHSIKDVEDKGTSATAIFQFGSVKQGPLCDAKRHYFHEMGCSPLHAESRVCASCHLWSMPVEGGPPIPIFNEYAEWRESAAKKGISCQDCHMVSSTREVARGSPPRSGVPDHGFMGRPGLRGQALVVSATVSGEGRSIQVDVSVRNQGAGHSVPGGLPGKQVILRVVAVDPNERELFRGERVYTRVLTDDRGVEVPFYAAKKVGADTRIAADEARREVFSFDADPAGEVRIDLVERALSPGLGAAMGVSPGPDAPLARARAAFGASGARGRLMAPVRVTASAKP